MRVCAMCAEEIDGEEVDQLDGEIVEDLSTAIRAGNRLEAEVLLDRLVAGSPELTEQVQRGRFKPQARAAA